MLNSAMKVIKKSSRMCFLMLKRFLCFPLVIICNSWLLTREAACSASGSRWLGHVLTCIDGILRRQSCKQETWFCSSFSRRLKLSSCWLINECNHLLFAGEREQSGILLWHFGSFPEATKSKIGSKARRISCIMLQRMLWLDHLELLKAWRLLFSYDCTFCS